MKASGCVFIIFFFFSSRRRHTRFDCDWSSDVCSSDLILSIAREDAALLRRLLAKGPVKVRLDIENPFDRGPGRERNVVADIEGWEGHEMVLLTAHFDSWDPAQGANDNGAGVATVLEAARVL